MHLLDMTLFYAPQSGGVKRYLTAKHAWLQGHAHVTHTLLVPGEINSPRRRSSVVTMRSPILPFAQGYRLPVNLRDWRHAVRELKPDLIEAGDPYHLAWLALREGQRLGVPTVGFYHSDLPRLLAARLGITAERYAQAYVKQLYSHFDRVLAPSRVLVERLHNLGVSNVHHQALGVDTRLFHPDLKDNSLRQRLGLPPATRLLIYAGRFSREKNLPVLLKAMALVGREYHLLLVGGGHKLPAQANVTVWPYRADTQELARLIASCDALVHPGDLETFGLVVLEALACGLPVIGMAAGGVAELVDATVGLLVPPRNPSALAEAISGLYQLDMHQLGLNARRKVEDHYSWDEIMPQLLGHYAGLLGTTERMPAVAIRDVHAAN
ncbi:MAG: glycosyltransferase family 1 protein [Gammaproteobacteria bacterium]